MRGECRPADRDGRLTYPIPFSDPENVIRIAQAAEKFGYDSVWGNDHMTTQNYVRAEFPVPPRFWEPLVTYAFVLSETKTIKVGTGDPGAADAATTSWWRQADLHPRSFRQGPAGARHRHRRLPRGVQGAAARRQARPRRHRRRGPAGAEPAVQGAGLLVRRQYYKFKDVELFPKPFQKKLPIYVSGNHANNIERTVKWADGWLPAGMHVDRIRPGVKILREQADKAGPRLARDRGLPAVRRPSRQDARAAIESFRRAR
jgi:alkanesulfonate monooxygenase SsuD/methylene tetrahydromethanopterin reductase-like flavin-dependent oxidoreductase (luciferase family)